MPGIDGFQFVSRFRSRPAARQVPVVLWTVKDLTADEHQQLQPLISAIVLKGRHGSADGLVQALQRVLPTVAAGGSYGG
jgi:CheY-like chemotaxis protein